MQSRRDGGWILVAVGCLGIALGLLSTVLLVREGLPGIVTAGPSVAGTLPSPTEPGGPETGGSPTSTPPVLSVGDVGKAAGLHPAVPSAAPSPDPVTKHYGLGAPVCDPPSVATGATMGVPDPATDVTLLPAAAAAVPAIAVVADAEETQ